MASQDQTTRPLRRIIRPGEVAPPATGPAPTYGPFFPDPPCGEVPRARDLEIRDARRVIQHLSDRLRQRDERIRELVTRIERLRTVALSEQVERIDRQTYRGHPVVPIGRIQTVGIVAEEVRDIGGWYDGFNRYEPIRYRLHLVSFLDPDQSRFGPQPLDMGQPYGLVRIS